MSTEEQEWLSKDRLYSEASQALRHYSTCITQISTVTIVQGFVLVSASIYLIRESQSHLAWAVALTGIIFTFILHGLQSTYWGYFEAILAYTEDLEKNPSSDIGSPVGPWNAYAIRRRKRFISNINRLRIRHGPFLVLALTLSCVFLYALTQLT